LYLPWITENNRKRSLSPWKNISNSCREILPFSSCGGEWRWELVVQKFPHEAMRAHSVNPLHKRIGRD